MNRRSVTAHAWRAGARVLALDRPQLIGVVNATPDSFSDGGAFASLDALTGHALRLVEEGAAVIDVGGESTRPGADRVGAAEQIDRTAPLVEAVRSCSDVVISIDTTRAAVAEAALDVGADVINDVSAGREDPAMLTLAAARGCGLILMHRRVPPGEDAYSDRYEDAPVYDDVLEAVRGFLLERCAAAEQCGVARAAIAIDPGLGFGKTVDQNYELISRTGELAGTGYPVVAAASRKSFIGAVSGVAEPRRRGAGTLAASVAQYLAGARLFRVHDVAAHREALAVARAIADAPGGPGVPMIGDPPPVRDDRASTG